MLPSPCAAVKPKRIGSNLVSWGASTDIDIPGEISRGAGAKAGRVGMAV